MARSFNGTSDYLEHGAAVVGGYPLTLACWCRVDDLSAAHTLMYIGDSAADTKVYVYVNPTTFTAQATAVGGSGFGVNSTTAPVVGNWTHVCAVFESAVSREIYINGVFEFVNTSSVTLGTFTATAIGTRYTGGVRGAFMSGLIVDAAIWNVALADGEVAMLGAGCSPLLIQPSALKAYWPLIGRDTPELSRWGRVDMTVNGANPVIADHPPIIPRPERSRALEFAALFAAVPAAVDMVPARRQSYQQGNRSATR